MAKDKIVDKRAVLSISDRVEALKDPRFPERVNPAETKRPKDLPGMNGKKLRSLEQIKSYISKIPACPRECK